MAGNKMIQLGSGFKYEQGKTIAMDLEQIWQIGCLRKIERLGYITNMSWQYFNLLFLYFYVDCLFN